MQKRRFLAIAMTAVLAFGLLGLFACGGSQGSGEADSASAQSAATESAESSEGAAVDKTAEYQKAITEDINAQFLTAIKAGLDAAITNDSNFQELASVGMDLDDFINKFASLIKFEVPSVDIDGDAAVAHVKVTIPDFANEEASVAMEAAIEKAAQDFDPENATQDELIAKLTDVMITALSDPSIPTTTEEFDVNYTKSGETWVMEEGEQLAEALSSSIESGVSQASEG